MQKKNNYANLLITQRSNSGKQKPLPHLQLVLTCLTSNTASINCMAKKTWDSDNWSGQPPQAHLMSRYRVKEFFYRLQKILPQSKLKALKLPKNFLRGRRHTLHITVASITHIIWSSSDFYLNYLKRILMVPAKLKYNDFSLGFLYTPEEKRTWMSPLV